MKTRLSQEDIIQAVKDRRREVFDYLREAVIEKDMVYRMGEKAVVFRTLHNLDWYEYGAAKVYGDFSSERDRHYQQLLPELKRLASPYLLPVRFFGNDFLALLPNGTPVKLPVLLMDWAGESLTLDDYIDSRLSSSEALSALLYKFAQMALWLKSQPLSHGNLRSDNILFQRHAPLALVDYDTMQLYAPSDETAFSHHTDDIPIAAIGLSLCLLLVKPELWHSFHHPEDGLLLFTKSDCRHNRQCELLRLAKELSDGTPLLSKFYEEFTYACRKKQLSPLLEAFRSVPEHRYTDSGTDLVYDGTYTDVRSPWFDAYMAFTHDRTTLLSDNGYCLPEYSIPEGTLKICDRAFDECSQIEKLTLPKSLLYVGNAAFFAPKFKSIVSHSPRFRVEEQALYNADMTELIYCFSWAKIFVVPSSVRSIRNGAFYCNGHVRKVVIPEGITSIGDETFAHCEALQEVVLPSTVTSIGKEAFCSTKALQEITLPKGLRQLGEGCFKESGLTGSIVLPDLLTSIPKEAFMQCYSLTGLHLPEALQTLEDSAFLGCVALTDVELPPSLKCIESYAFGSCNSLKQITFPKELPTIKPNAFENTKFENTDFKTAAERSVSGENANERIADERKTDERSADGENAAERNVFYKQNDLDYPNLEKIVSEETTTKGVITEKTYIEKSADGETSTEEITLKGRTTQETICKETTEETCIGTTGKATKENKISVDANSDAMTCEETSTVKELDLERTHPQEKEENNEGSNKETKHLKLPKTTHLIRSEAFKGQLFEKVTIPESVKAIESSAFEQCWNLKSISLPSSLLYLGNYAFQLCSSLKTAVIKGKCKVIGNQTFSMCPKLKKVVLPITLQRIADDAFEGDNSMEELWLPANAQFENYAIPKGCKLHVYTESMSEVYVDEDTAFELDKFSTDCTGLTQDLWLKTIMKGRTQSTPEPIVRLKIENQFLPITVSEEPALRYGGGKEVLAACGIALHEWKQLSDWLKTNRKAITEYWNGNIATSTFINELKCL